MTTWIIRNREGDAWHNDQGWITDPLTATRFTDEEKNTLRVPINGSWEKLPTWDHAYTVAFSLKGSTHPTGEDVTPSMLKAALLKRIEDLDRSEEWEEAVGLPYDSYEEGES